MWMRLYYKEFQQDMHTANIFWQIWPAMNYGSKRHAYTTTITIMISLLNILYTRENGEHALGGVLKNLPWYEIIIVDSSAGPHNQ
jgi:hypothetical protein